MNCEKIGKLIAAARKEKNMTQKDIASQLNITEQAVSKWERGLGCPDIELMTELGKILGMNMSELLAGEKVVKDNRHANMNKTRFYVCHHCNNIITSTNTLDVACCGEKLQELVSKKIINEIHTPSIASVEDELFVTVRHPMDKAHYISYLAYVTCDRVYIQKLYPEQNAEVRFKNCGHGTIYVYCVEHGLFETRV